ncbi:MAG: carbohydrate-binding protein [Verrucomicrobiales bacterium]|nr:carbohydrate-binding protein [Verrucomicrobiales bacterium]
MGWRSRSPISADKLDAGTHLLKPHGVSIKTSNEIDEKYLNHPPKFLGECVLVEPPIPWVNPWLDKKNKVPTPAFQAAAERYLSRFPDLNLGTEAAEELRAQVYERLAHQLDEWPKQQVNFIKYRREGIDVNFHVEKQKGFGFAEFLLPNQQAKRAAKLETDHFIDPFTGQRRKAYRLLMDDGAGKFKPITGDTDFLFMLNPDGTMPSLLKRVRAYSKMIRLGLQHGESFSFSIKKLREGWLRCCTARTAGGEGERMLAVTPHGELLTTMFRDAQSVIDGGPNDALKLGRGRGEFAFLEGTLTEVNTLERTASEAIPKAIRHDVAPMVTISALARMEEELAAEADRNGGQAVRMGPDGLPEIYDVAPSGPSPAPLRTFHRDGGPRLANVDPVETELLDQLAALAAAGWVNVREVPPPGAAGGQWRPVTVEEARGGAAGAGLRLSPYTYLTNDVPAGTSVLPVLPAEEVGWDTQRPVFAVGDQVVIDPGGPGEEFASIASVLPFTLSRPLQNLQEAGTMVLFLSGVSGSDKVPGALPAPENLLVWLRADAGLSLTNGTNVVSWKDQSRNGFVFTAPTEATRPVWVANSTSGVPAVRFVAPSTPRLQGDLGRTLTNATIFTLARWVDASSGSRYIYAFGTRDYSGLMMTLARRDGDAAYHYDGAAERVADSAIPGTGFRVFSQVFGEGGADRHRLSVDLQRVLDTRTTVGRAYSAVATNVVLGSYVTGNAGFVGDLVEWLVYDRVLSTEERFEVEEYLRLRAGLGPFVTPSGLDLSSAQILHYDVPATPEVSWALDSANRQWVQTGTGDPSFALLDFAESGPVIHTRIRASAGSGALGVVFGYQHPGSFHLLDWRQMASNHVDWGNAPAGMRLRTFHSPADQKTTAADLWSGLDPNRVTTWRTNAVPWAAGREYDVVLRIGPDETVVEVSYGSTTLETWTVPELKAAWGQFGHYACFLPEARFGPTLFPGTAPVIRAVEHGHEGRSTIHWMHGQPPFVIESTTDLGSDDWYPVAPATPNYSRTLESAEKTLWFRIRSAGLASDGDAAGGGRSQTFGNGGHLWLVTSTGPTRIEAENFDEGGEGVGYHDTTSQNQGGTYRDEAVDIGATTDFGGGHAVGNIASGEWLEYTIRVEAAGTYQLRVRTARGSSGARSARFLVDGADATGLLVIPATGSWASYATVESGAFELAAGTHILRADMEGGGFDLNWIEIAPAAPVVQTTFGNNGQPWAIGSAAATRIEAENFDQGGEGAAYHDATPQNAGNVYRAEAVDIGAIEGAEGGHAVSWTTAGEWLEFTIQVEQSGQYRLRARTARGQSGTRTIRFLVDGADKTGNLVIPATGNWQSYATVESGRFELAAGTQILRVDMTSADFNLDWFEIVPVVPVERAAFGNNGNPWFIGSTTLTRIEAENFDQGGPDIAYLDTDSLNQGGAYRSEDVDIQPTTDTGGGFNVLGIEPGEWLEYTINVQTAGIYQLRFRTARAPAGSRNLRVLVAGVDKTGLVTIPRTVSWQSWTTVTKAGVSLDAGIQVLRLQTEVGGFNLNWIEISP